MVRTPTGMTVLYDSDCGFCRVMLALFLTWDRAGCLEPVPIQSRRGARLLSGMDSTERLRSWHLVDGDGVVRSGGAGIPVILDVLPGASLVARGSARFPGWTARAYDWVATHRVLLGRPLGRRPRAWADRVVAQRAG